jgi:hypothetical protein
MGDWLIGRGLGNGVGRNGDGGRGIGPWGGGLEAADLLLFQEL